MSHIRSTRSLFIGCYPPTIQASSSVREESSGCACEKTPRSKLMARSWSSPTSAMTINWQFSVERRAQKRPSTKLGQQ
eukprot:3512938-Rhodomonas_salina.2